MKTFLEFLNSANAEQLSQTSGIGTSLAEKIVAARPFTSIEDSLRVNGLGESLLQRLQDSFEGNQAMTEETSLSTLPVEEPARPTQPKPTPRPTFGQRLRRALAGFLRFLLVLFIVALVFGGIGAAIYFGLPYLHSAYVVPVNQNTARIAALAHQQARDMLAINTELANLRQEINSLNADIASLTNRAETIESQLATIETAIETHNASLTRLEEIQTQLDASADEERQGLSAELGRQVRLTRAIELLSRARLYLSQSNFGQARDDILLARDLLAALAQESPEAEQAMFENVLFRLDLALENLPGFPVIAIDDLNIAWNLLVIGMDETAAPTPTP